MKPRFGPVMQLGFVVPDLDQAMEHWTGTVGVGPFFVLSHIQFAEVLYRGKPTDADISVAVAQWGEVQVELIQQFNESPSIYSHFPYRAQGGLQHVGVMTAGTIAHLRRRDLDGWILATFIVGKIAYEQSAGALPLAGTVNTIVDAHLYGAVGGVVLALLLNSRRQPL